MFSLFKEMSITPQQFREMDPRVTAFLVHAHAKRLKDENDAQEKAKRRNR